MIRHILLHCLTLSVFISQPACSASDLPSHYSAEAIEARVVDAETKKPIEGVIVTANWELLGGFEGNLPIGQMKVMETVTDKEGYFRFPAWGPEKRSSGYLREKDPQLLLFKSGYEYRRLTNPIVSKTNIEPLRRSQWNGRTIELKRMKGPATEQFKELMEFSRDIERFAVYHPEPCNWLKIRKALKVMMHERVKLEAAGVATAWDRTVDKQLLDGENRFISVCGQSAGKVLQELKVK